MNPADSPDTARRSPLKLALVTAPVILLLGMGSGMLAGSSENNPWFAALEKPALYPPAIAFPLAWSTLYLLMGIALALVLAAPPGRARRAAVIAFAVQFALNLAWAPAFFAGHRIDAAMAVIAALGLALVVTIVLFAKVDKRAALLLAPYLAWVLFASGLNFQLLADNGAGGRGGGGVVAGER